MVHGFAPNLTWPDSNQIVSIHLVVLRMLLSTLYVASWSKCSAAGSDPCGSEFPFDGARRFLSDFSECEWAGITCNEDDCVTEIEFEENNLIGTM